MQSSEAVPSLLTIPNKVGNLIYKEVFTTLNQGFQVLYTCRHICDAAQESWVQRPLRFSDQSDLYRRLDAAPPESLRSTSDVTLGVRDVDILQVFNSVSPEAQAHDGTRLAIWDLYQEDLVRLRRAFSQMPNMKKLTLQNVANTPSHLYRSYLDKVLEILPEQYPELQELSLLGDFHHQDLLFLMDLPVLTSFSFDGISSTSPSDLSKIFANLNIRNLSLISHQPVALHTSRSQPQSENLLEQSPFTIESLDLMEQLATKSTKIMTQSQPPLARFFTPEMLGSLQHSSTLRSLTISMFSIQCAEILRGLEKFLQTCPLRSLELDLANVDKDIMATYSILPSTLQDFWIRVRTLESSLQILRRLFHLRSSGEMLGLRRIVLIRLPSGHDSGQWHSGSNSWVDEHELATISRKLAEKGLKVSWSTRRLG